MRRNAWFFAALFFLLMLQVWYGYLMKEYPFYGIELQQSASNQWVVKSFDSMSAHLPDNLQVGDTIVALDNKDPSDHYSVKKHTAEQFHSIDFIHNGKSFHDDTSSLSTLTTSDLQAIFGSILTLILTLVVFIKVPTSKAKNYLLLLFLDITGIFIILPGTERADFVAFSSMSLFLPSIPFIALQFLQTLFNNKKITSRAFHPLLVWWLPICYFPIYVIAIFGPVSYKTSHIIANVGSIAIFTIGILINLLYLFIVSLRYRGQRSYEATLLWTIWSSLCISLLPLASLSLIPSIFIPNSNGLVNPIYTGYCVLFFPASFAFLIGTNQLYDIQLVIRRLGISAVISLLPSTLLVGLVRALAPQVPFERLLVLFLLVVLLFTFVLYALEYFTSKLVPIMFPRRHQLSRSLRNIAKRLGPVSNLKGLKDIVLVDLVSTLQVHGGAIVFRYRDGSTESITVGAINTEDAEHLVHDGVVEHTHYTSFEITSHEAFTAYLVMTRKKSNTLLGQEEVQWLRLIMTYLSVTLENIHLIRKLTTKVESAGNSEEEWNIAQTEMTESESWRWLRKLSFELQEKERTRIANDLHDTTMQDLFFMKRRLVGLLDKGTLAPEDAAELEELAEFTEIVNTNLRQSCFELHPHVLREAGLLAALEKLVQQEKEASGIDFTLSLDGAGPTEELDLDAKRHLFRIVQELINNARKHSQAYTVALSLHADESVVDLLYIDDGVGFDQGKQVPTPNSGIGLEQIKNRVSTLNGKLELKSSLGKGVQCQIRLPLMKGLPFSSI